MLYYHQLIVRSLAELCFLKVSRVNQFLTNLFCDWLSLILLVCVWALKLTRRKGKLVSIHDLLHSTATLLKQCYSGYVTEKMVTAKDF